MTTVEVRANKARVLGFESFRLDASIEAFATSFQVTYAPSSRVPLRRGDFVQLTLGGTQALEGYVDGSSTRHDAAGYFTTVRGRSRLGDLVDCSATVTGRARSWRNIDVVELARQLTVDYGVRVEQTIADQLEPLASFRLGRTDKIAQAIRKACQMRGLSTLDAGGVLQIGRAVAPGETTTLEGRALLGLEVEEDWKSRYSHYRFRGQSAARDVTSVRLVDGEEVEVRGQESIADRVRRAREVALEVEDPVVTRLRRLEVVAAGRRRSDLGRRALLERNIRSGRSLTYTATTGSWFTREGKLWRPGMMVLVRYPALEVRRTMLVAGVVLEGSAAQGILQSTIRLVPPQTYDTIDQVVTA